MKALVFILSAATLALIGYRLHDIGFRLGDLVAWWILAVTLGLEALIVIGGAIEWRNDPRVRKIAEMRMLLEMNKDAKRRGRRVQERAI
jgi:hypothetical protein